MMALQQQQFAAVMILMDVLSDIDIEHRHINIDDLSSNCLISILS